MKQLDRSLGLFSVIGISVSAMLGSGIFVLPGLAAAKTGPSVWLAYLIAGICALPAALSKAELATAMPESGGSYVYIDRAFGPLVSTISGLGLWLSLLFKASFALVGFGAYLSVFTDMPLKIVAIAMLMVIIVLNVIGVKNVGKIQIVVVLITLGALAALVSLGFPTVDRTVFDGEQLQHGIGGLLGTAGFVFVSYAGVTKAAAVAEEVHNPERNLPIGILLSLVLVTIIYTLVVFIMYGNISPDVFRGTEMPVYLLAKMVGGPLVGIMGAVLGVLTMTSMANAGLLASSRFPFAMSRDKLLPQVFHRVHSRFRTPVAAVVGTGLVMALVIFALDVEKLAKLASAFVIAIFIVENVSVMVLREVSAQWYKPIYRSPMYPWVQIFGVLSGLVLLSMMGVQAIIGLAAVILPGAVLYYAYGRKRTARIGEFGKMGMRRDLAVCDPQTTEDTDPGEIRSASVLVSLFGNERSAETIVEMGIALADRKRLVVQHITEIQDNHLVEQELKIEPRLYSLERRLAAMAKDKFADIEFKPVVSRDPAKTVHFEIDALGADCLVIAWGGRAHIGRLLRNPHAWLVSHIRCNLALFRDTGVRYIKKILVYADPGPHDVLVVKTADQLAELFQAEMTLVRFVADRVSGPLFQSQVDYVDELRHLCRAPTTVRILRGTSIYKAMTEESAYHDLLVLGAPPEKGIRGLLLTSKEDRITRTAACSVLRLRTPREKTHAAFRSGIDKSFDGTPPIVKYLFADGIDLGLKFKRKEALFHHFAHTLETAISAVPKESIEKSLWERERTQNTAVGHGLALPHATINELDRTFLTVFTTREPIDYNAADKQKVDVFLVTVGPPSERQIHLELLANVAHLVLETSLLSRLRQSNTAEEAWNAIRESAGQSAD